MLFAAWFLPSRVNGSAWAAIDFRLVANPGNNIYLEILETWRTSIYRWYPPLPIQFQQPPAKGWGVLGHKDRSALLRDYPEIYQRKYNGPPAPQGGTLIKRAPLFQGGGNSQAKIPRPSCALKKLILPLGPRVFFIVFLWKCQHSLIPGIITPRLEATKECRKVPK